MEPCPVGSERDVERPTAQEPTALFVNTASRTGQQSYEAVRGCLENAGATLVLAQAVMDPSTLSRLVRTAADEGVKRVLVGGGDGTLSSVAAELAGRDVRMAVLPLGTCNDFARSLRIPADLEGACRIALHGEVRRIDVGLANGRAFLNAASIGLSSAVTKRISDSLKKKLGKGAFAIVAAGEAWSHRPFVVTLETDAGTARFEAHQVVVGNGRYHGGGQMVAPDASHDDRALDVYVIQSEQRATPTDDAAEAGPKMKDLWNLFRVATLLKRGKHLEHPAVVHLTTTRVRLTAHPAQEVDVDGELLGETPVEFTVRPAVLQVLVPARNPVR